MANLATFARSLLDNRSPKRATPFHAFFFTLVLRSFAIAT